MIAHFPDFTPLRLEHKSEIEKITNEFEPYSDFNFVSLFSWDTNDNTQVSTLHGNLVIKLKDYTSDKTIYSLIGKTKIHESVEALLEMTGELNLVPEIVADQVPSSGYLMDEEEDNFDYIYKLVDLAELNGNGYKKKRNKINQFTNELQEVVTVETLTDIDEGLLEEIEGVFVQWCFEGGKPPKTTVDEGVAILRACRNLKELDLHITTVRIKGKLKAFSVNEMVGDNYAVCHFEKTVMAHNNIGPFIVQQVAQYLVKKGCIYVNWEQDLGIAGLRQIKRSYLHSSFLKKYRRVKAAQNA